MGQPLQVDVDGARLVGVVRGDPTRPTIVLVHGYPDDSGLWDGVAPMLADTYRVVTYDVRGHGGSDAPRATSACGFDHLMSDLLAVVDAVGTAAPVHLVGHDWGAIQGWEAVTRPEVASHIASFTAIAAPGLDHAGCWVRRRLATRSPSDLAAVTRQAVNSWYIAAMQVPVVPDMVVGSRRLQQVALRRLASDGVHLPEEPVDHDRLTRNATSGMRLYRANVGRVAAPRRDARCGTTGTRVAGSGVGPGHRWITRDVPGGRPAGRVRPRQTAATPPRPAATDLEGEGAWPSGDGAADELRPAGPRARAVHGGSEGRRASWFLSRSWWVRGHRADGTRLGTRRRR